MEGKLTKQDRKFVEKVIETGNLTQSVQEAYDIEDSKYASVKGQRLIAKDSILNAIEEALPDDLLARKHLQFLNSEREEIGIKALDMSYKVKGKYAPEKSISLNMNAEITNPKAKELAERYEEELKKSL